VAQAFEAAGRESEWGAPSFAFCAKGGNYGPCTRPRTPGRGTTLKPGKKRRARTPSVLRQAGGPGLRPRRHDQQNGCPVPSRSLRRGGYHEGLHLRSQAP